MHRFHSNLLFPVSSNQPIIHSAMKNSIQNWIGIIALLGMLLGFVASRAILSISMIVMVANACWPLQFKDVWRRYMQSKIGLMSLLYFMAIFISGLWSERQDLWFDILVLNLPFLILPLGMMTVPLWDLKFRKIFVISLYAILLAVIMVSLVTVMLDWDTYVSNYAHSKMIPTIEEGDHIRFSLSLCLALIPGIAYLTQERKQYILPWERIFIIASMAIICIYLHILSAKTGLLSLYMLIGLMGFYYLMQKGFKLVAFVVPMIAIAAIVLLGYFLIPTFEAKINYVLHEINLITSGQPLDHNYSDAGRIISYQVALDAIKAQPFLGTGAGDLMPVMHEGYSKLYPDIPFDRHLIPHNQYLYSLLSFGIILFPAFLLMVLSPFVANLKRVQFFLNATTILLLTSMLFEAMLQVQLGIFVYLYFTLIWYTWKQEKPL